MNAYLVRDHEYTTENWVVEAENAGMAIRVWRENMIERWKESGDYEPGEDEDVEPTSVELLTDNPVLRKLVREAPAQETDGD